MIEFYEDNHPELYNLKLDRSESTNLAKKMPRKVKELRRNLSEWRKRVDAQMMTPNPGYNAAAGTH